MKTLRPETRTQADAASDATLGGFIEALAGILRPRPGEATAPVDAVLDLHERTCALLRRHGALEIRRTARGLRLQGRRLRLPGRACTAVVFLEDTLARAGVAVLRIRSEMGIEEWPALARRLQQAADGPEDARGMPHVELVAPPGNDDGPDRDMHAGGVLENLVQAVDRLLHATASPTLEAVRVVRRTLLDVVDAVDTHVDALLRARARRRRLGGLAEHSASVGVLCVIMGRQVGLSRDALLELGMCGVLHDIGKQRLPADIVDKPGALDADEWVEMMRHPREGLVALQVPLRQAHEGWRPMLAAYEHHMKIDQSGYPRVRRPRKVGLFTRIVSVADVFDAVTSPRSYRSRAWRPERVLRNMLDQPRWGLDRCLVKVLLQAIGLYPVGSLVRLESGRMAVVVAHRPDRPHAPLLRVVGEPHAAGDRGVGSLGSAIVHSLDPGQHGVDIDAILTHAEPGGASD